MDQIRKENEEGFFRGRTSVSPRSTPWAGLQGSSPPLWGPEECDAYESLCELENFPLVALGELHWFGRFSTPAGRREPHHPIKDATQKLKRRSD